MESEKKKLILIDSDGLKEEISVKAACRSGLIKSLLEINPDSNEIPLKIKTPILKKVKEYLEHYEDIEPKVIARPLPSNNFKECVEEWDYNFINVDFVMLNEIILASSNMDIKPLCDLCCAKEASLIQGKTTEEIRQLFGISHNFTEEEEQQILEENQWSLENL